MDTVCSSAQSGPASPGQAKQQPLHLLRALPFVVSCRGAPAASQQRAACSVLRSFPRCRCCVRSCLPLLVLLLVLLPARAATSGGTGRLLGGTAQPHHSFILSASDHELTTPLKSLPARCRPHSSSAMSIQTVYRKPIFFHTPAGWQPTSKVDSTCRLTTASLIACLAKLASYQASVLWVLILIHGC